MTEDKLRANGKGWRQAQYSATSLMMMMMILVALDSPTKTFKGCFLQPYVFFHISPVHSNWKFEPNVQLVGFMFGSLLCTTEASYVQVNLPLSSLWLSSVCSDSAAGAKIDDEDDDLYKFSSDSESEELIYFLLVWALNPLLKTWEDLFCSLKFVLF